MLWLRVLADKENTLDSQYFLDHDFVSSVVFCQPTVHAAWAPGCLGEQILKFDAKYF